MSAQQTPLPTMTSPAGAQTIAQLAGNPCLRCGACCAHFRVSFYWAEADPSRGGTVPADLAEDLTPVLSCMKGTNQARPRCAARRDRARRALRHL